MYLLEEIWSKIFSYLDEYTLQNVASLVCKDWLNVIRNDCKLSGHLTLKRFIYFADINSMLRNNWPKLKVGQIYLILQFQKQYECLKENVNHIQLPTFACIRLLNKPYENEVTLRG